MSRPRTIVSYLHHRQSGRARAVWTDAAGVRREKLLPGRFGSAASRKAHAQFHSNSRRLQAGGFVPTSRSRNCSALLRIRRIALRWSGREADE